MSFPSKFRKGFEDFKGTNKLVYNNKLINFISEKIGYKFFSFLQKIFKIHQFLIIPIKNST